jgi:NhaP-type Na+/H+ or K+/H+ antiporter
MAATTDIAKSPHRRTHSEFALASFWITLGSACMVATWIVLIQAADAFHLSSPGEGFQTICIALFWVNLVGWGIGVGLAIAGLFQKNRKKILSTAALTLSVLIAIAVVCETVHILGEIAAAMIAIGVASGFSR